MRSAEGKIELAVLQVRDSEQSYRSRLMDFLKGNTDVLDYLVLQMYTRGLSTRNVEDVSRNGAAVGPAQDQAATAAHLERA